MKNKLTKSATNAATQGRDCSELEEPFRVLQIGGVLFPLEVLIPPRIAVDIAHVCLRVRAPRRYQRPLRAELDAGGVEDVPQPGAEAEEPRTVPDFLPTWRNRDEANLADRFDWYIVL